VSPRERADVVVVGGGLLGLATAYALRDRRKVVLFERETVGHVRAGSHGPSRIFRLGYPDRLYVEMARQSLAGWHTLAAEAGCELLERTGQLSFGPGAVDVLGALRAAGAPVEELSEAAVAERFPAFAGRGPAVFEPESGVLAAADVLAALRSAAHCELRERTHVLRVEDSESGVAITTDRGTVEANVVVLTAGPWTAQLTAMPTYATLEHVAYLRPRQETSTRLPVFIEHREPAVYGLPTPNSPLYKVALHHAGEVIDPDASDFSPRPHAVAALEHAARTWLPEFDPEPVEVDTCIYDNTGDEDFILERAGNVVVGAGTSGHGFKFGVLLGELLASLVEDAPPAVELARFARVRRPEPPSRGDG
jgi:sarcosine oxidase